MTWDEEAVARHLWLERKCIVARLEGRCHRGLTFAAAHMDPAVLIIEYGRNTASVLSVRISNRRGRGRTDVSLEVSIQDAAI